jgi:integrase
MADSQLHRPLSPGAKLNAGLTYDSDVGEVAEGIPCFYWSNGQYCFEINSYILYMWVNEKKSLTNRGGSLRLDCMQLSRLVRFVEKNRLSFLGLTDTYFTIFIKGLTAQVEEDGELTRQPNIVRSIGSRCLDFLSYCGSFFGYSDFVSLGGVIRGVKVDPTIRSTHKSAYRRISWYHHSFPVSSEEGRREPVTDSSIKALRVAARKQPLLKGARSKLLISVLANTGCRRIEAARVTVADVMRAYRSNLSHPLLRVPSAKGNNEYRFVPVPHVILQSWVAYIEDFRKVMIDDWCFRRGEKQFDDHGFLFICVTSCQPLSINTVTNEIGDLKKLAGLQVRSHPHMFRHRFITDKFKELIIQYDLQNTDVMRRALANSEVIKRVLQQWTGHKVTESLDRYIHLAFNELARMEKVVEGVFVEASVKALGALLQEYYEDWEAGLISAQGQAERTNKAVKDFLRTRGSH